MQPSAETIRAILEGKRPTEDLSGVTLDGKRLPRRDRVAPWNLSGVILRGAVLTRLDLTEAKFTNADLSGAAFRGVNLLRADFTGATAAGALFNDVNLAYAEFRDADLRGAAIAYANLADVSFRDADLHGASVNAVRLSLNGSTHALGLKEALNERYGRVSYPFAAGVSGDAFCLAYLPDTGQLSWGGYAEQALRAGLAACGLESEFVNETDLEDAWRRLTRELRAGHGAITPVHVGDPSITGSAFGGSEWIFLTGYDADRDTVRARCLRGDAMEWPWEEFARRWCMRHPQDPGRSPLVYTFCVVKGRRETVHPGEAVLRGIRNGLRVLDLGDGAEEGVVYGIPAYDLLLRDLDVDPRSDHEGCGWLGPGVRHLHGSRWALRDFLLEARRYLTGGETPLARAVAAIETAMADLASLVRLLPWSLAGDEADAVEVFLANREEAARRLRAARSREEEARDALAEYVAEARPS